MRVSINRARALRIPRCLADAALLATVFCLSSQAPLLAQGSSRVSQHESEHAAQMRVLNTGVLQLHGQMQENPASADGLRSQAAVLLAKRASALQTLIGEDPKAALSFAFSAELLSDLGAKFSDSAVQLESHVELHGSIERWISDNTETKTSRAAYQMKFGGQLLTLYFAGPVAAATINGSRMLAKGVRVGQSVAVESVERENIATPGSAALPRSSSIPLTFAGRMLGSASAISLSLIAVLMLAWRIAARQIRAQARLGVALVLVAILASCNPEVTWAQAPACSTTGPQNTAVLLVTFPGVTPPPNITQQSVSTMFFGPTGPSLDGFLRDGSYGQTSATGNVFGWFTLDSSYADCTRLDLLRDAAIAAAANSGVAIDSYNRIFVVNTDFGCGWTGMAINSCTTLNSPSGSFVASASFLNASWQRSQSEGAENAAHEMGHNMGLDHAQSRTFGTEPLGPIGATGTVTEYGDIFSDMSCSNIEHYALPHKAEILNWISSGANYQVVQNSGTWTLQPLEASPAGLLALKVQRGTGSNSWLWVEYRQPIGIYDSVWDPAGALVHFEDSTTGSHTQLLDFTPGTSSVYDAALMPGNSWSDPYTNLSLSVLSANPNGVTVSVTYGAPPCVPAAPSVTFSPLNPSLYPGQEANYAVSVTNNDSAACPASNIGVSSTEPSGWGTSFSTSALNLAPGQSASLTMQKTAPSGTAAGTYAVDLNAVGNSLNTVGTANATVVTPPSLAANVSVPGISFTRPGTVSITASVSNGGVPAAGASVTFRLTNPNSAVISQNAVTNSSGVATWTYKLGQRTPAGLYSAAARASLSSGSRKNAATQSVSSNTVTFSVQ